MPEPTVLSPFPNSSPAVQKESLRFTIDWTKWFNDLSYYVRRLLNSYDIRKSGIAVLVAGEVVVANVNVLATSYIRLTAQNTGGTAGHLSITLTPGVGFTITSTSLTDTRTIFYEIVEGF